MASAKVKAFAERILQECEQEGLTVGEVAELPTAIEESLSEALRTAKFSRSSQCEQP